MRMKIQKTWMAGAALLAFLAAAPGAAQARAAMPKTDRMAMAEFKKLLAANDVVVIDVRSASDYVSGHIPGALSMPEETLAPAIAEKLKRMGKPIALYCS
jgi:predicted sulfurtransferase